MGKKSIVSVTYEDERISKKIQLTLLKNVCYVSPVWSTGRFMAVLWVFYVNGFLSINQDNREGKHVLLSYLKSPSFGQAGAGPATSPRKLVFFQLS